MNSILSDQSIIPDIKLISNLLGENAIPFEKLLEEIHKYFPGSSMEWKYYRDAKSWLLPVALKKKNICWISLPDKIARVSIWFGKAAEPIVENSNLPESIKERYRSAEITKMGRGIALYIDSEKVIDEVIKVLDFKSKLK